MDNYDRLTFFNIFYTKNIRSESFEELSHRHEVQLVGAVEYDALHRQRFG